MAACYAAIAASAMAKADPTNATYYKDNLAKYTAKVDQLDQLMKDGTASMPAKSRVLLTYHDAYAYFAAHYGWKVIGAIQVSSFEDPTPKEVAELIKQIKAEKVPAIFGSEVFPSPVLAQIASTCLVTAVVASAPGNTRVKVGGPAMWALTWRNCVSHSRSGLANSGFATTSSALIVPVRRMRRQVERDARGCASFKSAAASDRRH